MLSMDVPPDTRYAAVGDADVAYQILGEGPPDLLYFYGFGSQLDLLWDRPLTADYFQRLASFSRLILFDRRGTGLSDPLFRPDLVGWRDLAADRAAESDPRTLSDHSNWEEWAKDLKAVLDAAESRRAAIFAAVDSGPIACLFAATYPDRVGALILHNSSARYVAADDYPIGQPAESVDNLVALVRSHWGTRELQLIANPGMDEETNLFNAKIGRAAATPRAAAAQYEYILRHVDVREALPLIQAPTLVFQNQTPLVPIEQGHYLVEHIPSAQFVELSGTGLGVPADDPAITDGIREFLTGDLPDPEPGRMLATVLFTDIEGSTERLASLGDNRWGYVLSRHDQRVGEQIGRFGGRAIKTTGDGFLAAFGYPSTAIRCGQAILAATSELGLSLRVGMHTAECRDRGHDLEGIAVHIAARVCALARGREVLVTRTVRDLVFGTDIQFVERDREYELKGVPGSWKLFVAT
jgi:class 3 adenylate cyclase